MACSEAGDFGIRAEGWSFLGWDEQGFDKWLVVEDKHVRRLGLGKQLLRLGEQHWMQRGGAHRDWLSGSRQGGSFLCCGLTNWYGEFDAN